MRLDSWEILLTPPPRQLRHPGPATLQKAARPLFHPRAQLQTSFPPPRMLLWPPLCRNSIGLSFGHPGSAVGGWRGEMRADNGPAPASKAASWPGKGRVALFCGPGAMSLERPGRRRHFRLRRCHQNSISPRRSRARSR